MSADGGVAVSPTNGGVPYGRGSGDPRVRLLDTGHGVVAHYDFGWSIGPRPRIAVLKLDHLGDFIIGLPALGELRSAFPQAHIQLVVGSWNRGPAVDCGFADEVVTYDYFPQHAAGWDGRPCEAIEEFRRRLTGRFDIAIDLRVHEDTRFLLNEINATVRCGIGSRLNWPFMNIILPDQWANRGVKSLITKSQFFIEANRFESRAKYKFNFSHETDAIYTRGHLIFGPFISLPEGKWTATFNIEFSGVSFGLAPKVTIDITANNHILLAERTIKIGQLRAMRKAGVKLEFLNDNPDVGLEFRVGLRGMMLGRLTFGGVRLDLVGTNSTTTARLKPAELHIGEQLSMLVGLIVQRCRMEPATLGDREVPARAAEGVVLVVAPFSNSDLRDWPAEHFATLLRRMLAEWRCTVTLIGSAADADRLSALARAAGGGPRIRNLAGKTAWSDVPALLRQADLVICNNSGVAHLAAENNALTLALYSGSHQPQEWGPRGSRAHALALQVPCSPCGYDHLKECPNAQICMKNLGPDTVFDFARSLLVNEGFLNHLQN